MPSRKNPKRKESDGTQNENKGISHQTEGTAPSVPEPGPSPTSSPRVKQESFSRRSQSPDRALGSSQRRRPRSSGQWASQTHSQPQKLSSSLNAKGNNRSSKNVKPKSECFAWPPLPSSKEEGAGSKNGWLYFLTSCVYTLGELDEELQQGGNVTPEEVLTFRALNRFLPSFAKLPAFYAVDFFTRRRVMFVFLTIAILLGYYSFQDDVYSFTSSFSIADEDRPGIRFLENYTMRKKYPLMIVPGFITTALEVWKDQIECVQSQGGRTSNFRQRMFGPMMLYLLITDPVCYLKLISLDKDTGFDPPNVKIRPDMGFSASDFVMPGYWVWAKILVNLADIGYDPQSIAVFSYDWRLSPQMMHRRDGYFYNLRAQIQFLYEKNNERVVVLSHSYGSVVMLEFFKWAEKHEVGWMDKYVVFWVNLGGAVMGVAKSVSATLSGEAKDTLMLPRPARQILESRIDRDLRTESMRTWSCLTAMYPRGCNELWPDLLVLSNGTRLTAKETIRFTADRLRESGHISQERFVRKLLENFGELPVLPQAPRTTVVCLYGVEKETETGYVLSEDNRVNATFHNTGSTTNGVAIGDGDGTIPLRSLGYMCRAPNGWKQSVGRVITREHKHTWGSTMDLRGGSSSGDHVDILGNYDLIETILKIVSGNVDEGNLSDRIYSDIDTIIAKATGCTVPKKHSQ